MGNGLFGGGLGSLPEAQRQQLGFMALNDAFGAMRSVGRGGYRGQAMPTAIQMLQQAAQDNARKQQLATAAQIAGLGGQPGTGQSGVPTGPLPAGAQTMHPGGYGGVQTAPLPPTLQERMAQRESSGNPNAISYQDGKAYVGPYQFGPERLADFNAASGERLRPGDLMDQGVSDRVWKWHQADIDNHIQAQNLDRFIGQEVDGVRITRDGMRAAAHIGGKAGLTRYLETGGAYNPADSNGTRISDYVAEFESVPGPKWGRDAMKTAQRANPRPAPPQQADNRYLQALFQINPEAALELAARQSMKTPDPSSRYKVVGGDLVDLAAEGGPSPVYEGRDSGPKPMGQLAKLNQDLNAGLISPEDYKIRREQILAGSKGIRISPDGTIEIGGSASLGRAGQNALDMREIDMRDQLARLEGIEADLGQVDDALTLGGRAKQWGYEWADFLGAELDPEQSEYLRNTLKLRAGTLENLNYTIKAITGAAMTEAEAKRIGATLPDVAKDGPQAFATKLEDAISRTKAAIARYHMWRNGGLDAPEHPEDMDTLFNVERKMDRRFKELAEMVDGGEISMEEAERRYQQEFGL